MFNIPTVTKNLLIVNIIAFIAYLSLRGVVDLNEWLGLHFMLAPNFGIHQLFTYMFLHAGWTHLFFNMFALWMFGCVVERVWGPKKFLFYYISCGVGAGLFQEIAQFVHFYMLSASELQGFTIADSLQVAAANASFLSSWTTVGASGAVYAILLAFGMTFPEERIFIFPLPIPIKAKWFVIFYAGAELFQALAMPGDGVAHLAHLGGMIIGFFMIRYWNNHPTAGYGRDKGMDFFEKLKGSWEQRRGQSSRGNGGFSRGNNSRNASSSTRDANSDWDYNARKKVDQEEIDRILDKIRKNGYDSLTREEKQRLFDQSRKN